MGVISQNLRSSLKNVFTHAGSAKEIETILSDVKSVVDITPSVAVVPVTIAYTASASAYAPTGALTIAAGATPTVVELLEFCLELKANIVSLQAVLHAKGLTV